jgi:hypothetical protein
MPNRFRRPEPLREIRDAIDRQTAQQARSARLIAKAISGLAPTTNDATSCKLTIAIGGDSVNPIISVDTTTGTVTLTFEDDKGDPATAPAGATVVFSSDTPAVCAVTADATNPLQGDLAPASVGTFNLSAAVTGTYANGTPIAAPAAYAGTVVAGAAAGDSLVVQASN